MAATIGREAADFGALLHPLPLADDVRRELETETLGAVRDLLNDFGHLPADERQRFTQIASLALDRRLAHHATNHFGGSA